MVGEILQLPLEALALPDVTGVDDGIATATGSPGHRRGAQQHPDDVAVAVQAAQLQLPARLIVGGHQRELAQHGFGVLGVHDGGQRHLQQRLAGLTEQRAQRLVGAQQPPALLLAELHECHTDRSVVDRRPQPLLGRAQIFPHGLGSVMSCIVPIMWVHSPAWFWRP